MMNYDEIYGGELQECGFFLWISPPIGISGYMGYPLVMTNSVQLNIAIGIVDLPIKNGDVQ